MVDAPQLTEEQRKALEEKIKSMTPEQLREFQKQQCIFCQIITSKIPSKKVYEDEKCIAVLDINPAAKGHLLLLPKEHYSIMPQVPDADLGHLAKISKDLSQLLLRALKVEGTNIFVANGLVAGQRAQHFMIHIIPRRETDGVLGLNEKLLDAEMQQKVQAAVGQRLNEVLGIVPERKEEKQDLSKLPEDKTGEASKPEPKKSRKKASKKKEEEKVEEESEEPKKTKGDVSLDDIANLFK